MRVFTKRYCIVLLVAIFIQPKLAIKWLALGRDHISWESRARHLQCGATRRTYGLSRGQTKICKQSVEVMPHVSKAASQALDTCQLLFENRRWNCSTALLAPNFTPDLTTGTREQAFVYALSSASLTYVISRACASGDLFNCSCAGHPRELPSGNFKWGGCGDNVRWASQFAKRFTDSAEKKLMKGASSAKRKRGSATPTHDFGIVAMGTGGHSKSFSKTQLAPVNLHNTRIGRKEVEYGLKTQCACHGVSGTCSIKICWKGLGRYHDIGENLQKKYTSAVEVSVKTFGAKKDTEVARRSTKPLNSNLVFVTKSPDYCLRDDRTGSLGTSGRLCNETSTGQDSCDVMCCGRGYTTLTIRRVDMCQCKFRWCCEVICKKCVNWVDTHVCN